MRRQIERTVIILGNSLNQIFRSSHSDVFWNIGFLADWPNPWKIWAEEFLFHYLLKLNFSIRIYPEHFQRFQEQLFSKNSCDAAGIVLKSILQNQKGFYKIGVLYLWSKVQVCRTSVFYKMIGMYTRCRHVRSSVRNAKNIFQIDFTFSGSRTLQILFNRISGEKVNIFSSHIHLKS